MHFFQTVGTAFGNEFALLQAVRATFNQAFLFQAITATFGDEFAFLQTVRATFNQAFLFQAIATTFGNGLTDVRGVSLGLRDGLFSSWQGKSAGGQDRECNTEQ